MKKRCLQFALLLFIIEIIIALFIRDAIIKPYGGDFLVVIFLYCLVRGIWNHSMTTTILSVLLFTYTVEVLQYLNIVDHLGLKGIRLAEIIIGTGFSWWDMLAYTLGVAFVFGLEKVRRL